MIEVVISPKMLVSARDKAADMGRLQNSITNGAGNLAGFIGELIALKVMVVSKLTHMIMISLQKMVSKLM